MKTNLIKTERILSPTQISIADYTINPYRGCPFGCVYCYAQENKTIKKKAQEWGSFVDVKINAVNLLEKEVKNKKIKRVLLGSTVECYPPQEEKFCITQKIIKFLNEQNIAITILTKSSLLERDLELISRFKKNKIYLTINFSNEKNKNLFEPKASTILERWKLLELIQRFNINHILYIAPYLPDIQNIESIINKTRKSKEISIEVYNPKMGNWPAIEKIIKGNFSQSKWNEISKIFSQERYYKIFIDKLSKQLKELEQRHKKKILLLSSELMSYYSSKMPY